MRYLKQTLTVIVISSASYWVFSIMKESPQADSKLYASQARQALDLMAAIRAYPDVEIPESGMVKVLDQSRRAVTKMPNGVALPRWRTMGPHNVGGRTLDIALNPLNPNTLYAGSASGGLWRSYSGGIGHNSWQRIPTGFSVLAVSSIAIAPDDSNTIYIGTGEVYGGPESFPGIVGQRTTRGSYGIGILKTTDGGLTWMKSLDWLLQQRRGVQKIGINPLRPNVVWAATTEGTFRSDDAGATWEKVLDVVQATDIAINPEDPAIVFVACGGMGSAGHGIYRTLDDGVTWDKMLLERESFTFFGKARLSISRSSPNIVYASIGLSNGTLFPERVSATWLFKTTDSGDSWKIVSSVDYASIQGWYAHDVAVHPEDPNVVWCGGQPSVPFLSTSGGSDLVSATILHLFQTSPETAGKGLATRHADYHAIVFHPDNPDIIYFANDGGVFRTLDGGATVQNCSEGYQTTQFYNGTTSADLDSLFMLGGLQDNGTILYTGNLSWATVFDGDGSWTAINQATRTNLYVSWQFLRIERSLLFGTDPFRSIFRLADLTEINFIAPFILSPADNRTLYAGGTLIYKSPDGGHTWLDTNAGQPLNGNPAICMAGSFQDPDVVYVGTSAAAEPPQIFRTINGGMTWSNITNGLPDRIPTDLAVDPEDDDIVYITLGGFNTSHVFKTEDGGESWTDIGEGLPDIPTWAVVVDPGFREHIYVGTEIGVHLSPDRGASWYQHMNGLDEAIFAMDLNVSRSNRTLRVATHGNGAFESNLLSRSASMVTPEGEPLIPQSVVLAQNFPNPFNSSTRIQFYLEEPTNVDLRIYTLLGEQVKTLVRQRKQNGWHQASWDGNDDNGLLVASGVYFYRLLTPEQSIGRKLLLVK